MSNYYENGTTQTTVNQPGMPMQQQMPIGYGYGFSRFGMRPRRATETKPFYLTSEFGVSLIASIAIAITAASSDAFGAWRAWILISAIVVAYTLSRGFAKAGTQSHASDPRDNIDLNRARAEHHDVPQHYSPPQQGYRDPL